MEKDMSVSVNVPMILKLIQVQRCRKRLSNWTERSERVKYQREIVKERRELRFVRSYIRCLKKRKSRFNVKHVCCGQKP